GNVVIGSSNENLGTGNESLFVSGSMAGGSGSVASGVDSFAFGWNTTASGYYSAAFGMFSTSSGYYSFASGYDTEASGFASTASGAYSTASGNYATAFGGGLGSGTIASGSKSVAFGSNIEAAGSHSFAVALDGNQSGVEVPANTAAFMGGSVGIGTTTPAATLGVDGLMYIGGTGTSTITDSLHVYENLKVGTNSLFLSNNSIQNQSGELVFQPDGNDVSFGGSQNFFWDDSTNRLGIGTSSPASTLHAYGTTTVTADGSAAFVVEGTSGQDVFSVDTGNEEVTFGGSSGNVSLTMGPAAKNFVFNKESASGDDNFVWQNGGTDILTLEDSGALNVLDTLTATLDTASRVGVIVKAASSQTANLTEWQNSAGSVLAKIGPNGEFQATASTTFDGNVSFGTTTEGSVLFAGSNGKLSEDNSNFFWDDSTNRLGIGTSSPTAALSVFGTSDEIQSVIRANSSQTANLTEWQNSSGGVLAVMDSGGGLAFNKTSADHDIDIFSGSIAIEDSSSNDAVVINTNGITLSQPASNGIVFENDIFGDQDVTLDLFNDSFSLVYNNGINDLNASITLNESSDDVEFVNAMGGNFEFDQEVEAPYFTATSTSATSTFAGNVVIGSSNENLGTGAESLFVSGSMAGGFTSEASGTNAFAFGNSVDASGLAATAFGTDTTASGDYSTVFGAATTASGNYSTAFGLSTTASGYYSTA
ncbi:MAG: hypothetical protein WEC58_02740, partial [Candidatus Paceibacterota bacterium]